MLINNILIVTDNGPFPTAPGNTTVVTGCEQKCKGSSFAYGITQNTLIINGTEGSSYLDASQAVAWVDKTTGTVTPYYHYIGLTSWNTLNSASSNPWNIPGIKTIRFKKSRIPGLNFIKTSQGNGIAEDNIIGIEKKMGSIGYSPLNGFEVLSGKKTVMLASKQPCLPQLANFTSIFNLYNELVSPTQTVPFVPTLVCDSDPNNFMMSNDGVIFTTDPTNHDHPGYTHVLNGWLWYPDGYWSAESTCGTNKGVLSFDELNAQLQLKSATTYTNGVSSSDFIQFEFQKVGDPNSSIVIYPNSIEQVDGSLSFSSLDLPVGLYNMNVIHSDLTLYSVYFESLGAQGNLTNSLSNFLSTNIYQVPVVNNSFNVSLNSTKNMIVRYELFDINGELVNQSEFEILNGEEVIYHVTLPSGRIFPSNILVNKFTCLEDGSSITTQTLKSIN